MVDMIRVLWQTTDSYRSLYYSDESARQRVHREHRSIVAALRAGETDRAVRELDQHREHAVEALAKRIAD
jgi:DNA-binding GntR family transcriptional regulator